MSNLTRYDPFRELRQMQRQMFDVFDRGILDWPHWSSADEDVLMALNVRAENDRLIVEASLPGVEEDNIDVRLNRDVQAIEQAMLYPDQSRTSIYVAVKVPGFLVDDLTVRINENEAITRAYSDSEARAFLKGDGWHRQ